MDTSNMELVEFSIMVITDSDSKHEFTNIHPLLLSTKGIVPDTWERDAFYLSDIVSNVRFENGIRIVGRSNSLYVEQSKNLKLGIKHEPSSLIRRYIEMLAPDIFFQSWIDWTVHVPHADPSQWILDRFKALDFVHDDWDDISMWPCFLFNISSLPLRIQLKPTDDGDFIRVYSVARTQSFEDDEKLNQWLSEYQVHEKAMLLSLKHFLEVVDDAD